MAPRVQFPDAAALAKAVLDAVLDVPVRGKVPNPRPDDESFVTVRRSGGPRLNLVADNAQLTIDTYGPTEEAAHDLGQQVRCELLAARGTVVGDVQVYEVGEAGGLGLLPDPVTQMPRYRQIFTLAARGTPPT